MSPPGAAVKSARERMQIVSAYNELGSYRAAAKLCGTTHKTVRRVVERQRAGGLPPPRKEREKNTDQVADLVAERVRVTDGRISAKRLLPVTRAAGYAGSARNLRRLVADAKARHRRQRRRLPALGARARRAPGDRLDARRRPADVRRRARLVPLPLRALRHRSAAGDDAATDRRVSRGDRRRAGRGAERSDGRPARQPGRRAGGAPSRLRALRRPLRLSPRLLPRGRPGVQGSGRAPDGLRPARSGRTRRPLHRSRAGQRRRPILVRRGERRAALGDRRDPGRAPGRRGRAPSPAARAARGARRPGSPARSTAWPACAWARRATRCPTPWSAPRCWWRPRKGRSSSATRARRSPAIAWSPPARWPSATSTTAARARGRPARRARARAPSGPSAPSASRPSASWSPRRRPARSGFPPRSPRSSALEAAFGRDLLVGALQRALRFGRYRAADVRAILAAGAGVAEIAAAGTPLQLELPAAPARPLAAYAPWSRP